MSDAAETEKTYTFAQFAEDFAYELARSYGTRGTSVYAGAVELTPEECQRVLFDIIADIHAEETRLFLKN